MFFSGWESISRTVVVGVLAYIGLVFLLRISGKRTLSKMNAFDLVVTVAIGSTLATILLSRSVSLLQGMTAFFVLIGMQYLIAWLSARSDIITKTIKSKPELLYYQDQFFWDTMKRERILEVEILQACRAEGIGSMKKVEAVILETDGTISVIQKTENTNHSTLKNIDMLH